MSIVADLIAFLRAQLDDDAKEAGRARGTVPLRRPGNDSGRARPRRMDEQALDM